MRNIGKIPMMVTFDKNIKAIYMILEDDIAKKTEWWNNSAFVSESEKEYEAGVREKTRFIRWQTLKQK